VQYKNIEQDEKDTLAEEISTAQAMILNPNLFTKEKIKDEQIKTINALHSDD